MNRDPLEELFARERDEVRELAPEPGHWDELVARSRRPTRRGWLPYVAVAAAAAVVGGVLATDALRGDAPNDITASTASASLSSQRSVPHPTPSATTSRPEVSSTPVVPATTTTTPSGPLPVPVSFDLVSITNAGDGHLYAIGSATCPKGPCTSVVASEDDGRTWTARSTFEDLVPSGSRSTPDGPGEVVGVRFATPDVGYVYGSTLRRTADGGRTWSDVDVDQRLVLSLETDGDRVWMATAGSCSHDAADQGCTDLQPRTGSVQDTVTTPVSVAGMPTRGESAWVVLDGDRAYYNVTQPGAVDPAPPMRLSGTPGVLPVPDGCAKGLWVSATANTRGTLVGVCRSADRPEQYSLAVSTDEGKGWSTRKAPDLGPAGVGGVWLTAADATHLVALTGGQPSSSAKPPARTSLLVSSDGGEHWRAARTASPGVTDWAGAAGGRLVYAVGGGASYQVSRDAGGSFSPVPLRR